MGARIRGHYRIDSAGRVEPISDVNASLRDSVYQPPLARDLASERKARLTRICAVGLGLCCIGLALTASLPMIQHMVVSSESARMAMIRRSLLQPHAGHSGMGPFASEHHHWHQHFGND